MVSSDLTGQHDGRLHDGGNPPCSRPLLSSRHRHARSGAGDKRRWPRISNSKSCMHCCSGYDADLAVQVLATTDCAIIREGRLEGRFEGEGDALALEAATGRPVLGFINICSADFEPRSRPLRFELETVFHEMIHVLV